MTYVIQRLNDMLTNERHYLSTAENYFTVNKPAADNSLSHAYKRSMELAKERIPQIELALEELTKNHI